MASSLRRLNAIILGAPGGGKGTISKKLIADFPFTHVSTGDVLRKHVADKTPLGIQAKSFMTKGQLVPDSLMFEMLASVVSNSICSILFDGFPRTVTQAKALESMFSIDLVISLDIPHQTIIERLSDRWIHAPSSRVYSYSYNPPKVKGLDDVTGEPLVQRADDRPETIKKRLEDYETKTKPILTYYQNNPNSKTIVGVFAGTESNVIYPQIKSFLKSQPTLYL